jgi:predicted metalloprotease
MRMDDYRESDNIEDRRGGGGGIGRGGVGIGAQGGDIEATVKAGRTANGTGLMINSSRAILYAGKDANFAAAARQAALETRDAIRKAVASC